MVTTQHPTRVSDWMLILGTILLLMGAFGFLRIVHVSLRHVPYPSSGVLPATILTPEDNTSFGRETDCRLYPQPYYEADGKTLRPPTEDEKALQEEITRRCINGFDEDRAKQKQYDRNQSAFLIFVGAGLLFARRFLEAA